MATGLTGSFATIPERRHDIFICFDTITITRGKRTLLDKASGIVRGGKLTALVSSCGGRGDYHLLNVLAAQHDGGGLVIAQGTLAKTRAYRQHCALIDEEMTVIDYLTIRQNLLYGSEMRSRASKADHEARLRTVVSLLKLDSHVSRQVHACSHYVRRRVSVARELMLNPAAIFVDSAIEGLATHEAREFLSLLRAIAVRTGCVVAVSVLQPRWTLLELVDDVIVLQGPTVVFVGSAIDFLRVAATLQKQSSLISRDASPGVSVNPAPSTAAMALPSTVEAPETCLNTFYRLASNPHVNLQGSVPFLRERTDATFAEVTEIVSRFSEGRLPLLQAPFERVQPMMPWKFFLLCQYGALQVWNRLLVHIASAVLVLLAAVLVGVVYQRQDLDGQAGMQNRIGIIFFLISSTFLHNLLFVESHKKAYVSFQRHRAHGYFDCLTYFCYWTAISALQRFVGCIVFMGVVYALAQVHGTVDLTSLQSLVAIMASTSFCCSVLVWLVCCAMPNPRYAHFLLFSIYAFDTILAGIVLNVNTLPKTFQDLSLASIIRLGYESAVVSEFANKTFGCHKTLDGVTPPAYQLLLDSQWSFGNQSIACFTGDGYMDFLGFSADRQWSNMGILAYITIGMMGVALIFMWLGKGR
jgi:ABC-type multidrug transport system ATPase subunit